MQDTHGRSFLREQDIFGKRHDFSRILHNLFEGMVNKLAMVDFTITDRTFACLPCIIGPNNLPAAIIVYDMEFQQSGQAVTIQILFFIPRKRPFIPAICQRNLQFRSSRQALQLLCYIICLILQTMMIARPARRQQCIPYFCLIDGNFIESMR